VGSDYLVNESSFSSTHQDQLRFSYNFRMLATDNLVSTQRYKYLQVDGNLKDYYY
jgi:hypothetical protein